MVICLVVDACPLRPFLNRTISPADRSGKYLRGIQYFIPTQQDHFGIKKLPFYIPSDTYIYMYILLKYKIQKLFSLLAVVKI